VAVAGKRQRRAVDDCALKRQRQWKTGLGELATEMDMPRGSPYGAARAADRAHGELLPPLAVTEDGDTASLVNPKPSMTVSLRVVGLRLIGAAGMHRLGEMTLVPPPDLWRLVEFGSRLDLDSEEHLIAFAERVLPSQPWLARVAADGEPLRSTFATLIGRRNSARMLTIWSKRPDATRLFDTELSGITADVQAALERDGFGPPSAGSSTISSSTPGSGGTASGEAEAIPLVGRVAHGFFSSSTGFAALMPGCISLRLKTASGLCSQACLCLNSGGL
jgi:hypothetical protein